MKASSKQRRHQIAESAGLIYVSPDDPGWTRRRCGKGFSILDLEGEVIQGAARERVIDLVLPPAWSDVWICASERGHLQAVGHDQRGRRQYHYHDQWAEAVRADKYADLHEFGASLPALREQLRSDSRRRKIVAEQTTALAIELIDRTGARVGNREYARDNDTRGLTTLEKRHAAVGTTFVRLQYTGKSHKSRDLKVSSRRIARHVGKLKDSPGKRLLRYQGVSGWCDLHSDQVNEYLTKHADGRASAKRFRTWQGSVVAFLTMCDELGRGTQKEAAGRAAIRAASESLGNTVAVCREHYVHPSIVEMEPEVAKEVRPVGDDHDDEHLNAESQLINFLRNTAHKPSPAVSQA